jgi:hypothetical protein
MTKQILKGAWAVGLLAVLAILSVPVEAADVTCTIPFRFTANGTALPQGTYSLTTNGGVLTIRGDAIGAFVMTSGVASRQPNPPQLVFHKHGDQYDLRQVWMGGDSGRELPPPPNERSLARAARAGEVATGPEQVVIPVR